MKTKYSAKIDEILEGKIDDDAFKSWLMAQPLLDQAAIMREIQDTIKERLTEEEYALIDGESVAESVNSFENSILDVKLNQELASLETEQSKDIMDETMDTYSLLRQDIIEGILKGGDDLVKLKVTANEIIALEKKFNLYDPENWKEVLGMLGD